MSRANVCETPCNVAVTFATGPVTPDTAMTRGYGEAGLWSRMLMKLALENVCDARWPSGKLKLAAPRLFGPSWSCRVAVIVPPHEPVAVKVKGRVTAGPPGASAPK